MTVATALDSKEVPFLVDGKPRGQTMTTRKIDERRLFTLLKMNSKPSAPSKMQISADGRTLTVENDVTSAANNHRVGKQMR